MNKQITSIFLVAGTCIGAGMIALPMTLAKLGIISSILLMFFIWLFNYYSSLVSVELNLHSERGLSLESLGKKYSGKKIEFFCNILVKLLCYSLLAAYIYGGSSIIKNLFYLNLEPIYIQTILTLSLILLLQVNNNIISKINGYLFICFLIFLFFLIFLLFFNVNYKNLPLYNDYEFKDIASIIFVVFTSFGYQVVFHTLRDYCGNDVKMLKNAFFYESIIPLFLYISWTFVVLSVIYNNDINFYNLIIDGNIDAGILVDKLSKILSFNNLNFIIWLISILAIFTSIIGVGLSLKDCYINVFKEKNIKKSNLIATLITYLPPYLVTVLIPNAFIKVLGYAGIILVIIAILLPIYLYFKANIEKPYVKILNKYALILCSIIGIFMIILSLIY